MTQFAVDKLALQLQAYHEEKHRHQPVINPMLYAEVEERLVVEYKTEMILQYRKIALAKG